MRKLYYIVITLFLFFGFEVNGFAQSNSYTALISHIIYTSPETWKMSRTVANSFWDLDLFNYPRIAAQDYIMDPSYDLYSGTTLIIDPSWNRMVYTDNLKNWIRYCLQVMKRF